MAAAAAPKRNLKNRKGAATTQIKRRIPTKKKEDTQLISAKTEAWLIRISIGIVCIAQSGAIVYYVHSGGHDEVKTEET